MYNVMVVALWSYVLCCTWLHASCGQMLSGEFHVECCVLRAACCVLRVACCVLRA